MFFFYLFMSLIFGNYENDGGNAYNDISLLYLVSMVEILVVVCPI